MGVARADVGLGVSGPASVDTKPPLVTIDALPENFLLQGGQSTTFHWQTADDNPSGDPTVYTAEVLLGAEPGGSVAYHPQIDDYAWLWTAPEASTAQARLVVRASDAFGNETVAQTEAFSVIFSATDVPDALPREAALHPAAPNPFNPTTTLAFSLPRTGAVRVDIYGADGRLVRRLIDDVREAGRHTVVWDGQDSAGRPAGSGVYLVRLQSGPWDAVRRIALVK